MFKVQSLLSNLLPNLLTLNFELIAMPYALNEALEASLLFDRIIGLLDLTELIIGELVELFR
jgi:hypothetical protein